MRLVDNHLMPMPIATSLREVPTLARRAGIDRLFVKNEGERPLGNFKFLGGHYAALRALKRNAEKPCPLICASDGNHGLAVASAAVDAGASARIFLPSAASPFRAARIEQAGGEVLWVNGTYDDAVEAAAASAERGDGILVPDTSATAEDPTVADVMEGYRQICTELSEQLPEAPTHLFVQAGVGGLAAALASGLSELLATPPRIIVVEPEAAAGLAGLALACSDDILRAEFELSPASRVLLIVTEGDVEADCCTVASA